jgi:L,D-transpeptidase YbiS
VLLILLVAAVGGAAMGTGFSYRPLGPVSVPVDSTAIAAGPSVGRLQSEVRRLVEEKRRLVPRGRAIVIDRVHNRISLHDEGRPILDAVCSTGSGMLLVSGARRWRFETPRGRFKVLSKVEDPVWKKPDWAFIEEGRPAPPGNNGRLDYNALGEYALYFGNGYMIHGTLYERLLGQSVTHGCIRVGRDDLRRLYAAAGVGTPIYIF